jgi:hypothetical protein
VSTCCGYIGITIVMYFCCRTPGGDVVGCVMNFDVVIRISAITKPFLSHNWSSRNGALLTAGAISSVTYEALKRDCCAEIKAGTISLYAACELRDEQSATDLVGTISIVSSKIGLTRRNHRSRDRVPSLAYIAYLACLSSYAYRAHLLRL